MSLLSLTQNKIFKFKNCHRVLIKFEIHRRMLSEIIYINKLLALNVYRKEERLDINKASIKFKMKI